MARGLGPQVTSVPSHLDGLEQLTKAPNASSSFLPFSRLTASCPDAYWWCRHLWAAFLPRLLLLGAQRGGHTALPELPIAREVLATPGLGSGRHFHCIQLGFSSLMIVSRAHPDNRLIQTLEIFPSILPKFEVGAKGRCQAGQSGVGQAVSAIWLVVVLCQPHLL